MAANIPTYYFLIVAAALFAVGLAIVLVKRNAIVVLMGIELMLNACNINLVAFGAAWQDPVPAQMFTLFIMVVAAAEVAVALAIVIQVYGHYKTVDVGEINQIEE